MVVSFSTKDTWPGSGDKSPPTVDKPPADAVRAFCGLGTGHVRLMAFEHALQMLRYIRFIRHS